MLHTFTGSDNHSRVCSLLPWAMLGWLTEEAPTPRSSGSAMLVKGLQDSSQQPLQCASQVRVTG